jgi:RNA polymerase sigma-70 factor (ECF subfamily)
MELPLPPTVGAVSRRHDAFPTTHWSIVLQAGEEAGPEASSALETLCQQYWYPLYAFVRRQGKPHHEAEDCTQEFLTRLLQGEGIARARPERGRFRTFLLTSLRNLLTNEWHRKNAAKRGGGEVTLPLEFDTANERFIREPTDDGLTPEQAYDRNWALGVIDQALANLRSEYTASGRGALFDALAPAVWGGGEPESPATKSRRLGLNEGAYNVALHRLRKRLQEHLRTHVAATVATEDEVGDELRHLIAAVGTRPSRV